MIIFQSIFILCFSVSPFLLPFGLIEYFVVFYFISSIYILPIIFCIIFYVLSQRTQNLSLIYHNTPLKTIRIHYKQQYVPIYPAPSFCLLKVLYFTSPYATKQHFVSQARTYPSPVRTLVTSGANQSNLELYSTCALVRFHSPPNINTKNQMNLWMILSSHKILKVTKKIAVYKFT